MQLKLFEIAPLKEKFYEGDLFLTQRVLNNLENFSKKDIEVSFFDLNFFVNNCSELHYEDAILEEEAWREKYTFFPNVRTELEVIFKLNNYFETYYFEVDTLEDIEEEEIISYFEDYDFVCSKGINLIKKLFEEV